MCERSKTCAKRLVRKVFCAKWPVTLQSGNDPCWLSNTIGQAELIPKIRKYLMRPMNIVRAQVHVHVVISRKNNFLSLGKHPFCSHFTRSNEIRNITHYFWVITTAHHELGIPVAFYVQTDWLDSLRLKTLSTVHS